jgi:peptide/nickel transport system ATP-binding protein
VELLSAPERVLAGRVRGRRIGLVPQSPGSHLTPVHTGRTQLALVDRTLDELRRLRDAGHAILLVTHDLAAA